MMIIKKNEIYFNKSLKFGIVFSIIAILLIVINIIIKNSVEDFVSYQPFISLELFANLPGEFLMGIFSNELLMCLYGSEIIESCPSHQILIISIYFLTIIFYFVIGIVVGFFYNKLKNKLK